MQISFTQPEIQEALIELLEKQITLVPGQSVSIEFDLTDPKDIIAYIDVLRQGQTAQGIPAKAEPAKTITNTPRVGESEAQTTQRKTRGPNKPKTPAVPTGPEEANQDKDPVVDANLASETLAAEPDTLTAGEAEEATQTDVPFADPEVVKAEVATIEATKSTTIFPNAGSSAPAKETTAAPPVSAKSLFANLVKPTNTPQPLN